MELTQTKYRITSIDILRGAVMIIMALDHTRDFFHQPAQIHDPLDLTITTPAIFLTRWITHFCAPIFVFLSGVSAYLSSQRKTKNEAGMFLIKRGLWLVLIEILIVTLGITFNLHYNFIIFQVIWAIGCSMIFLGILVRISYKAVLFTGLILFFGHNIFDLVTLPGTGAGRTILDLFFTATGSMIPLNADHSIFDLYAILPWTGAMLLGYSMGLWFKKDFSPAKRKQLLLLTGVSLISLFVILRFLGVYGNPVPWKKQDSFLYNLLAFVDTNKYPPSLLYFCMTLGPACIFLSVMENVKTRWSNIVSTYGRVPFFYYVLHFYILHTVLVIVFFATGHTSSEIIDPQNSLIYFRPLTFGYGLPVVYGIWLGVVILLYLPCKWFSNYKKTHSQWWLSYL